MIVEILLALLVLVIWWALRANSNMIKYAAQIPGPVCYPIVGNLLSAPMNGTEALMAQSEMFKKYGSLIRLWMGSVLLCCMSGPEDVEILLKSPVYIEKTYFYDFLNRWLGHGLLLSGGDKWRLRRKAITPTFHFKILEDFIEVFNRNGNTLVELLSKKVDQGSFDVLPYITAYTLDIICETAMGTRIDAQKGNNKDYQDAIRDISSLLGKRMNTPILHYELFWTLSGLKFKENELVKRLHQHTYQVIKTAKEAKTSSEEVTSNDNDLGIKKKTALLTMLLEMKRNMNTAFQTDADVQEEVDTFMFAGHDTTTSGICFALYLLASNPDVQQTLFEELSEKFSPGDCNPTMEDLNNLKYLDMVVKECLRLCPSVPAIARHMKDDVKMPSGFTVPSGAFIMINIYHMHRNPKYFPNPEVFNPHNFLPEVAAQRHPYAYIPFSAGPRNCIGQKFALLEMKSTLAKVITNFKVECEPDFKIVIDSHMVLQARNGHMIKLSKRI